MSKSKHFDGYSFIHSNLSTSMCSYVILVCMCVCVEMREREREREMSYCVRDTLYVFERSSLSFEIRFVDSFKFLTDILKHSSLTGKTFISKYVPVGVPGDECDNDICICPAGT